MKTILILLCCCLSLWTHAQTFHLLIIADTEDTLIGGGCEKDLADMRNRLDTVARQIGYSMNLVVVSKNQFSREGIDKALSSVTCTSTDVLFFYYTGHGFSTLNRTSDFPLLYLHSDSTDLMQVHQQLVAKRPRLCITLGDCCNNIVKDMTNIFSMPIQKGLDTKKDQDMLRRLFVESRGDVLIGTSKRGEYATTHPSDGSYYSKVWIDGLRQAQSNNNDLSWETFLVDTENRLQAVIANFAPHQKHHSHWLINVQRVEPPRPPKTDEPVPPPPVKPIVAFSDMNAFVNGLADESKSYESRDTLRNRFSKVYFAEAAQVKIYISNLKKPVEVQPLNRFLSRMILNAPQVKWVNTVERLSKLAPDGRYLELTVQEVRR